MAQRKPKGAPNSFNGNGDTDKAQDFHEAYDNKISPQQQREMRGQGPVVESWIGNHHWKLGGADPGPGGSIMGYTGPSDPGPIMGYMGPGPRGTIGTPYMPPAADMGGSIPFAAPRPVGDIRNIF